MDDILDYTINSDNYFVCYLKQLNIMKGTPGKGTAINVEYVIAFRLTEPNWLLNKSNEQYFFD